MVNYKEKILIVDDEAAIRKLLNRKLSEEGYQCDEAESAEQALEKLEDNPPELVILDIKMPGKAGIDLLPKIKTDYPQTSIIMATAVMETGTAIKCLKQGADDYICKPFALNEVAGSIVRTLEKRKLELKIAECQQHLEEKVEQQTKQIRTLFIGAIEALVFALEAKDKYTAGHSQRVTDIAIAIGKEIGLSPDDLEDLRCSSLLHDVGKIAVDQIIQNKPGELTPHEYEHIMIHAQVGAGIVQPIVNKRVVEIIEHHHNHYDGSGLHQVIAGEDIPLGARVLAVADAFDAMTSERPYRPAMSMEDAVNEVKRCAGTQFDPVIAEAFLRLGVVEIMAKQKEQVASK